MGMEEQPEPVSSGLSASVSRIADDGVASGGKMDADLVSSAGQGLDFKEGKLAPFPDHPIKGYGPLGAPGLDRNPLPVFGMPSDIPSDAAFFLRHSAANNAQISLFHFPGFELPLEFPIGLRGAGDHHDAGRSLVQPVNDARPPLLPHSRDFRKTKKESIRQGAASHPGPGVDDHAAGLLDDDDLVILEEDVQRYFFRLKRLRPFDFIVDFDPVTFFQLIRRFRWPAVDPDLPFVDQPLDLVPGQWPDLSGKVDIQPFSLPGIGLDEEFRFRHLVVS